jgi:hypothetical protein
VVAASGSSSAATRSRGTRMGIGLCGASTTRRRLMVTVSSLPSAPSSSNRAMQVVRLGIYAIL